MTIREAAINDIKQIQVVRNAVKENRLSNPALVTDADCEEFLFQRGKGWVAVVDGTIAGFSIVDMLQNNVWALFVHPDFENQGIGRKLHNVMLDWYFSQTTTLLWLGTAPGTRAEAFYRLSGWEQSGMHGDELKFEMNAITWKNLSLQNLHSKN